MKLINIHCFCNIILYKLLLLITGFLSEKVFFIGSLTGIRLLKLNTLIL